MYKIAQAEQRVENIGNMEGLGPHLSDNLARNPSAIGRISAISEFQKSNPGSNDYCFYLRLRFPCIGSVSGVIC